VALDLVGATLGLGGLRIDDGERSEERLLDLGEDREREAVLLGLRRDDGELAEDAAGEGVQAGDALGLGGGA